MTEFTPTPIKRQLPAWISLAVVVLVILGGGFLIWRYWLGASFGDGETFGESDPPSAHRNDPAPVPDGIRSRPGGWAVRAGSIGMNVNRPRGAEGYDFNVYYTNLLDADQQSALMARMRIPRDQAVAKLVGVTQDQIDQLKKLPGGGGWGRGGGGTPMALEPADLDRIKPLWETYATAQGDAASRAEADILAALTDIGEKRFDVSKKRVSERVDAVKAILSPEQLQKFASIGR